jgi:MarR family transcriptional regulator, lower aerobic nicotinate degradation pathway regulator
MKNFDLDDQLGFNLYRVAMSFKREHAHALRDFKLTPEQWQALATLWRYGAMSQSEIARVTLQDAPAVSRMLVRMENDGWLSRQSDPNDARSSIVHLTEEGKRLEGVLPSKLVRHFRDYLKKFPEAKQKQLLSLLRELRMATADLPTESR